MSLRSSSGDLLFRRVELKVVFPPNIFPPKKLIYKAQGAKRAYGPEGIDQILMHTTDQLDQLYPWWDFQMVPLSPIGRVARYIFKVVGVRPLPTEVPSTEKLTEVEVK